MITIINVLLIISLVMYIFVIILAIQIIMNMKNTIKPEIIDICDECSKYDDCEHMCDEWMRINGSIK